jgi:hypothetical protein
MTTRYRIDAERDLYDVERAIKSNRKTARDNPKASSVAIADATLPSLERKRDAFIAELAAGLPDRPASHSFGMPQGWKGTSPPPFPACCNGTQEPIPEALLAALDIPAPFKRDKANRLPSNPQYGKD